MGISEDRFFDMTMRQFYAHRHGYLQREQGEWERARYIGYLAILPHIGKKRLKPTDLGKFPWETEETTFPEQSPEEIKKINERARRSLERFKKMRDGTG